jgi:hypothetical protein
LFAGIHINPVASPSELSIFTIWVSGVFMLKVKN